MRRGIGVNLGIQCWLWSLSNAQIVSSSSSSFPGHRDYCRTIFDRSRRPGSQATLAPGLEFSRTVAGTLAGSGRLKSYLSANCQHVRPNRWNELEELVRPSQELAFSIAHARSGTGTVAQDHNRPLRSGEQAG